MLIDIQVRVVPERCKYLLLEQETFRSGPRIGQLCQLLVDQFLYELAHGPVPTGSQQLQFSVGVG